MNVGSPEARGDGWWTVAVWPGHLSSLAAALNPGLEFVILEDHAAVGWDWRSVRVPVNESETGFVEDVAVRFVRMDLLMTPDQFRRHALKLQSGSDGGALIWQLSRKPPVNFRLSDKEGDARAAAIRGLDIRLIIDLPHDGEVAVISAAAEVEARAVVTRLAAGT
ncbi:hypothetical protein [Agromyces marinus]|uniref:hypothetical protein n=1 Tax=Agromyces marinus TaxID=1389020 RepID=UPI001F22A7B2|nr:hypothetical protein [Agromyces marinus]